MQDNHVLPINPICLVEVFYRALGLVIFHLLANNTHGPDKKM